MNITIINGSPKGANSITFQTISYLQSRFPGHNYTVIHAGKYIRKCEEDFTETAQQLQEADFIIFAYPVYTLIVPSQLHRFIELMKGHDLNLSNKYVTQVCTSKHFYDVTAMNFINDNCLDMGMKVLNGFSADMDDILTKKGQHQAISFFKMCLWKMRQGIADLSSKTESKKPVTVPTKAIPIRNRGPLLGKHVVILCDLAKNDKDLKKMITRFTKKLPIESRIINLRDFDFSGGCLGCFHCAVSGKCIYKDGFEDFLRNDIHGGSAIVYAFSIKDHSMGSLFKMFDDRQFCNGHRTVTMGMPVGYIVSGALSKEENLRLVINARAQVGGNYLAGIATDEGNTNTSIDNLAKTLIYSLSQKINMPANFYGVGGMKIFRDLIFEMQGMMKADHAFYKAHGQYDFPQKKIGRILGMYAVGAMLSSPAIQKKIGNKMTEGMLMPYKKILENPNHRR